MVVRPFKVSEPVMVHSTSIETEFADGMRGYVTGVTPSHVCIECYLAGETHTLRIPAAELVHLGVGA